MADLTGKDFVALVDLYDGPAGACYIQAGDTCEAFHAHPDGRHTLADALALACAAGFIAPVRVRPSAGAPIISAPSAAPAVSGLPAPEPDAEKGSL